jgi:hypothetical protein
MGNAFYASSSLLAILLSWGAAGAQAATEQAVTVGAGEWTLPGTLTLPAGTGPFPAVVLVHGSGPHDRDETIGPNKPFRDLAQGLADRGLAVLRYDKRSKVHAAKVLEELATFTAWQETVDDAAAAVRILRTRADIHPEQVFVLGHSFGGMMMPRIAQRAPDAAGFIILAGNTRAIGDMMVEQITYVIGLDGEVSNAESLQLEHVKREAARVKDPLALSTAAEPVLGAGGAYWLDLFGYHPEVAARATTRPLLILQGGRDYQVTLEDFARWKAALVGYPNVTFKLYPRLNHLFIEGSGRSTPAEYARAGRVAETVMDDIASWLKAAVRAARGAPPAR